MRNVPFPPPLTFQVVIFEVDPWTPRPAGASLPSRRVTSLPVKFERSVDERRAAAKKVAEGFFGNKREVSVSVADDHIVATVTKEKPPARVTTVTRP